MSAESLFTLFALAFAAAFSPGPNNVMLANSGATFGFRRTTPHILGVMIGFPVMVLGVGFILGEMFEASALLRSAIKWFGVALLLWVAWKIATAGGLSSGKAAARPMTFIESAGFQWINPKGWAMIIALTSQYVINGNELTIIPIIAGVFVLMGMISASLWTGIGSALTQWLKTSSRLLWFNRTMGMLIVASIAMLFLD